jgi:hypothetical protein
MDYNISKSLSRKRARKIWEGHHNLKIHKGLQLHHVDGNPFNNDISNLMVCTPEEHLKLHRELGDKIQGNFILSADWYKHASEDTKRRHREYSAKGGKSQIGKKMLEATKEKLRKANKSRSKPIEMLDLSSNTVLRVFPSVKNASIILGIQRAHIRRVIKGDRKQWKGYLFRYV